MAHHVASSKCEITFLPPRSLLYYPPAFYVSISPVSSLLSLFPLLVFLSSLSGRKSHEIGRRVSPVSSPPSASSGSSPLSPPSRLSLWFGRSLAEATAAVVPMSGVSMAHGSSEGRGKGRRSTPRRGVPSDPRASSSSAHEAARVVEVSTKLLELGLMSGLY